MQLVDTHVLANGDQTTTVVFAGEGNEEVCVRLRADGLKGDDAILRAKAVMVQLTQFEIGSQGMSTASQADTPAVASTGAVDGIRPVSGMGRMFQNGDTDRTE